MTRRRWALGGAVAIVAAMVWWGGPPAPPEPSPVPSAPPAVPGVTADPPRGEVDAASPASPIAEVRHAAYRRRAEAVIAACDLPIEVRCTEGTCASVVSGPDLDGPLGWLRLLGSRPRFVVSAGLRDLGVPPAALPCGVAIDALLPSGEVAAVELADGTEVWCSVEGDEEVGVALCDEAATDRAGLQAARFSDPDLRRLTFAR